MKYFLIILVLLTIFVVTINGSCCSNFNCRKICKLWCNRDYYCIKYQGACLSNGCCPRSG
ncbi:unnamed protein product [Meloidogyne enterolobii]|uniref:Uncharacterized protein n=1 Tax=Meloidogyne enterolobii TaxID=390850 RepID=A0ACB0YF50_MELEN